MDRRGADDTDTLMKKAKQFAARVPERPREAQGIACAAVTILRNIRSGDTQQVFVYDDPGQEAGPMHAVIRVRGPDGPAFLDIRERIVAEFKRGHITFDSLGGA